MREIDPCRTRIYNGLCVSFRLANRCRQPPCNVTRYEIIVWYTKDNRGLSMIAGPRVERVSRAYWSAFPLVRGNTVAPCLQCSEWTKDPIVPESLFLCRWDIRAPTDERTDGRRFSFLRSSTLLFILYPAIRGFSFTPLSSSGPSFSYSGSRS